MTDLTTIVLSFIFNLNIFCVFGMSTNKVETTIALQCRRG